MGGRRGCFYDTGMTFRDGMNSFQNASHSGIIGIALFLLLLRMLMFFCLFVLRTKPMSEDICHVIIDD